MLFFLFENASVTFFSVKWLETQMTCGLNCKKIISNWYQVLRTCLHESPILRIRFRRGINRKKYQTTLFQSYPKIKQGFLAMSIYINAFQTRMGEQTHLSRKYEEPLIHSFLKWGLSRSHKTWSKESDFSLARITCRGREPCVFRGIFHYIKS